MDVKEIKEEKLSMVPSAAVRQGVKHLKQCIRDPLYVINMGTWHLPTFDYELERKVCEVCFAGGIMAKLFELNPKNPFCPADFSIQTHNMLHALDCFRGGNILLGLDALGIEIPTGIYSFAVCEYKKGTRGKFLENMLNLADYLESFGL